VPVGAVRIPYEFVEKLKEELMSREGVGIEVPALGKIAEIVAANPNHI